MNFFGLNRDSCESVICEFHTEYLFSNSGNREMKISNKKKSSIFGFLSYLKLDLFGCWKLSRIDPKLLNQVIFNTYGRKMAFGN